MAEFCLHCWNKFHHQSRTRFDVILSRIPQLCEGCAKYKRIVEGESNLFRRWEWILLDFFVLLVKATVDNIVYLSCRTYRFFRK